MVSGRGVTCGHTVRAPRPPRRVVQRELREVAPVGEREQRVGERAPDAGLLLVHVGVACTAHPAVASTTPLPVRPAASNSASTSSRVGEAAGHRLAVRRRGGCRRSWSRTRPRPPRSPRSTSRHIALDLVGGGGALVGGVAHHEEPHRAVADVRGEVDGGPAARGRAPGTRGRCRSPRRCPRSSDARVHVLDVLERAHDHSWCSARVGAMVKPQLPATTVVTPWYDDGRSAGSQNTCAS